MFQPFTQPLFDHALIVQVAGPGQALDAGQHPRVNPQRDGHRLGGLGVAGHRGFHEAQVGLVLGPELRLGLFAVEDRHFFPFGNRAHRYWLNKLNELNGLIGIRFRRPGASPLLTDLTHLTRLLGSMGQRLIQFPLVEEPFFGLERASVEHANLFPVRPIDAEDSGPPADIPRLKNRACTENRGESGKSRIANGSSNDSSISCKVKELSRLKGGLFQSNSIAV